MRKLFIIIVFLISSTYCYEVHAAIFDVCSEVSTEDNASEDQNKMKNNLNLDQFISMQENNFKNEFNIKKKELQEKLNNKTINTNCNENRKIWNEIYEKFKYENYFDLSNYIYSYSYLLGNSCKMKDIEKLTMQWESFEKQIKQFKQSCIDPDNINTLVQVSNRTAIMLQFLRNTNNEKEVENLSTEDDNLQKKWENAGGSGKLQDYWYNDLYKIGSRKCPTESWGEVSRSFCKLVDNVKNLKKGSSLSDLNLSNSDNQKKFEEIGAKRAAEYLSANIDLPFVKIKSSPSIQTKMSWAESLKDTFDSVLGKFREVFNEFISFDLQEIHVRKQVIQNQIIKMYDVEEMLNHITFRYSSSANAQIYLESIINDTTEEVNKIIEKKENNNLYHCVNELKKLEETEKNECNVGLNNH